MALFTALTMTLVLFAAAFVIDIGMQRVARSDMQALADVISLDVARHLDGTKTGAQLTAGSPSLLQKWAEESRVRNTTSIGGTPRVAVVPGRTDAQGVFTPATTPAQLAAVPNAVRVTAMTTVPFSLGGATGVSSGDAARSAVTTASQGACFQVGSYLARVDSSQGTLLNPLLGGLLGTTVNLAVADYNGLATSDLTLAELVTVGGLGVATADQLLATDVTARQFLLASARVLDAQGKGVEATVLRNLAASASTPAFKLGSLIDAAPGGATDPSALAAKFNVLRLVQGAALLANKGNAVSLPGLSASLGIASTTATATVIEAPKVSCGPVGAVASTAQVRLELKTSVSGQTISVPALGTTVTFPAFDVTTSLDLGKALATLSGVTCANGTATDLLVALRSSVVGQLSVTANPRLTADFTVPLLNGTGVLGSLLGTILRTIGLGSLLSPPELIVDARANLSAGSSSSSYSQDLVLPLPGSYKTPVGSGSGALLGTVGARTDAGTTVTLKYKTGVLGSKTNTVVVLSADALFSQVLDPILSAVSSSVITPLVNSLQTRLVDPLAKLLGLQYGGADVLAVPTPTCTNPRLVG